METRVSRGVDVKAGYGGCAKEYHSQALRYMSLYRSPATIALLTVPATFYYIDILHASLDDLDFRIQKKQSSLSESNILRVTPLAS